MSETITLDLYAIHSNRDQLAKLHELQRDRLDEQDITGGDRPNGMRLSTADPVRRVKAAFDEFWQIPFDEGVGMRGHLLEDYLEVALFHGEYAPLGGKAYASQVAIQWHEHGRSAFDFVAESVEGADRVVSCKTSIRGVKPSAANIAQERRMMALAGYPAESVFEVWVIDPGTFRAVGPHEYVLEQEHIDAARRELDAVTMAFAWFNRATNPTSLPEWNDAEHWRDQWGLESTSGAFRLATLDASGAVEARNRAYLRAREAARIAKAEEEAARDLIRTHVQEQLAAAQAEGVDARSVIAYGVDSMAVYAIDKRGAMRCTVKPIEAAETAA
jgi:hypothetical protein